MSHFATNWAIEQRGLKPITKIVLWHLADCHNPAMGCFPTQSLLADKAEISRSSVNRCLAELEEAGLIAREKRLDPDTKRQLPTRYFLAFEDRFKPQDVATRDQSGDTESRVPAVRDSVSQSCDTLNSNRTSKTPLPPRSSSGVGAGGSQDLVALAFDDPLVRRLEAKRGKPFIAGRSGKVTVLLSDIEALTINPAQVDA